MKFEFSENESWSGLTLTPETTGEYAALLRMTKNSKAEKPDIYFSIGRDANTKSWCTIQINKLSPKSNKISTTITNR